ncbi:hypothetical protein U9M48_018734 [Paspalum notatum var. saurae]|uniref:Reverse transcriptase Ty1/copia-type domain-containing protein n=1 Tax=Paspalum notatum var. saurae TaxID=547442 RepID=A0AAQ3WQK2_PASNO
MQGAPLGAALRHLVPPGAPHGSLPVPPVVNQHRMVTRGKLGFRQPALFHTAQLSPVPSSFRAALTDPNWRAAMEDEHAALLQNSTWDLVPRPPRANVVSGKWIFKHKFKADGSLERYKARWVLRGFTQRPGIDCTGTFSPVPSGFEDPAHPDFVCRLNKSLYGLKQAPRAWFSRFATHLLSLGFVQSKSDTSLFIYRRGSDIAYLLVYVDDIVLTASSAALLQGTIRALQQEFSMSDLGSLHHFLGMHVQHIYGGLFLSQWQYMLDIMSRAGMSDCKLCVTPVDTNPKLSAIEGTCVDDATDFRSLAGALQYLTFTRPDIAYAVQQAMLFSFVTTSSPGPKRQMTASRSSAEAEYRAVANAVAEASWLRQLLLELHAPLCRSTLVYCDNIITVYMASNPIQHQRTKHIEIDLHFVRERVALGEVRVLHVPTSLQFADIFTKGLPSPVFTEFRTSLNT